MRIPKKPHPKTVSIKCLYYTNQPTLRICLLRQTCSIGLNSVDVPRSLKSRGPNSTFSPGSFLMLPTKICQFERHIATRQVGPEHDHDWVGPLKHIQYAKNVNDLCILITNIFKPSPPREVSDQLLKSCIEQVNTVQLLTLIWDVIFIVMS